MSSRASVNHLSKLRGDIDSAVEELESELDDTAISLLTSICAGLSLAAAGVRNGDAHLRDHARQCAADYICAMCDILEVWETSDVEIVDGPALAGGDDEPDLDIELARPDGWTDIDIGADTGAADSAEPPDVAWLAARDWTVI